MSSEPVDLPEEWEWRDLQDVAEVRLGRQRSPKNHHGENMVPYLRAANVTWDGLDLTDVKEMNFGPEEVETYALREGDIVLSEASGSASEVGKAAIWRGELNTCCFQNTLLRVRTRGPLPEYLLLVLREAALSGAFVGSAVGVGIHHLGAARLSTWRVPVPPIKDQQRIVEFVAAGEAELELGLAELRELRAIVNDFQGSLIEATLSGTSQRLPANSAEALADADREHLADHAEIRYGWTAKAGETGNARMLRITDIQDGRVDWDSVPFCDVVPERVDEFTLREGDVVFARTGATTGKSYRIGSDVPDNAVFASYLIRVRATRELNSRFLSLFFRSRDYWQYIHEQSRGIGQPNVNGKILGGLRVPLPPLDAQRAAADAAEAALDVIVAVERELEEGLAIAHQLRLAVLNRAVRGALHPHLHNLRESAMNHR